MRRVARMCGGLGFAGLVVGALAFGASQAFATVREPCSLCNWPEQEPCNTCCIEEVHQAGGDCFPSGSCVCYE